MCLQDGGELLQWVLPISIVHTKGIHQYAEMVILRNRLWGMDYSVPSLLCEPISVHLIWYSSHGFISQFLVSVFWRYFVAWTVVIFYNSSLSGRGRFLPIPGTFLRLMFLTFSWAIYHFLCSRMSYCRTSRVHTLSKETLYQIKLNPHKSVFGP